MIEVHLETQTKSIGFELGLLFIFDRFRFSATNFFRTNTK